MESNSNPSRRSLVQLGWSGLALAGLSRATGLKVQRTDGVLISVHLIGGNDGNNMIVPLQDSQYGAYARLRGGLAIPRRDLRPVKAAKNPGEYGFHPALKELHQLYRQGVLGIIANTGAAELPQGHDYESMEFLSGGFVTSSFAARLAGFTPGAPNPFVTGAHGVSVAPMDGDGIPSATQQDLRSARILYDRFPATPLGRSLAQVAAMIPATRGRRVLFSVPMSGFDTHRNQAARQQILFRELSEAMSAFYRVSEASGEADRTTLFTDSEFGRSLRANAHGGSEHGWGNHHVVLGGSVAGGDIHGTFPDLNTVSPDGVLEPSVARDDYFAALASWSGLSSAQVAKAIPRGGSSSPLGLLS